MDSITEILVASYITLMVGSAVVALTLGELKRKQELDAVKGVSGA